MMAPQMKTRSKNLRRPRCRTSPNPSGCSRPSSGVKTSDCTPPCVLRIAHSTHRVYGFRTVSLTDRGRNRPTTVPAFCFEGVSGKPYVEVAEVKGAAEITARTNAKSGPTPRRYGTIPLVSIFNTTLGTIGNTKAAYSHTRKVFELFANFSPRSPWFSLSHSLMTVMQGGRCGSA